MVLVLPTFTFLAYLLVGGSEAGSNDVGTATSDSSNVTSLGRGLNVRLALIGREGV
jgi:hypothetical protein